jgi:hypothetical protein
VTRPSFPSASEPSLRRLGVGGGPGGGDRPLRAQLVIALVVALVLLAVPLYLLRRPSGTENAPKDGGGDGLAGEPSTQATRAVVVPDAQALEERVQLGPVQRVKCGASARARGQEGQLCDRLPQFEEALAKAIRENVDCAPKESKEGSINYVLTIDFSRKLLHAFPGASGKWRGPQARRAARCVQKALPTPAWDAVQHQYRFYQIAILATYSPPPVAPAPPVATGAGAAPPLFD